MCDAAVTSREHVPPECLFPSGHRRNLITVPSCDQHNTEKSGDDEVVAYGLGLQAGTNELATGPRLKKFMRAGNRRPGLARAVIKNPQPITYDGHETSAIDVDRDRFDRVMDHTARGLLLHHTGRKHLGALGVHCLGFFCLEGPTARQVNAVLESLRATTAKGMALFDFKGENPEVFKYQVRFELPDQIMVRMVLY